MGPPGGGFHLPTCWGGRELFPIHGEVPTEGRGRGRRVGAFTSPLAGEVGPQGRVGVRISRKPTHSLGRSGTLPHSWGSTDRRWGMGPPGTAYTSPLAGEVGPQGRVGVRISRKPTHSLGRSGTLPHSWGSTDRRSGKGPPGGGFHLPTCWGGRPAGPGGGTDQPETYPLAGEVGNSSPFMGKYRPKVGEGAAGWGLSPPHLLGRSGTLPHSWGSTDRRSGMGPPRGAFNSPLAGEVGNSSPFMGKYRPKVGEGAAGWGLPISRRRRHGS